MRPHKIFWTAFNRWSCKVVKRRIDFVVAGTIKGGTTTLDTYLRRHPQIGMARIKEARFFDKDEFFKEAKPDYRSYHGQYAEVWLKKLLGDATPNYMYWPPTPERLYQYNPEMKIIISLRNPVSRAYSHWNMHQQNKTDLRPFNEAIREELSTGLRVRPKNVYVHRGFYSEQLERIWQFFPRERTFIFRSDELKQNHVELLNRICVFLNVHGAKDVPLLEYHKRTYASPIDEPDKKLLQEIYAPEIKKLEQMLGWDCSDWLKE